MKRVRFVGKCPFLMGMLCEIGAENDEYSRNNGYRGRIFAKKCERVKKVLKKMRKNWKIGTKLGGFWV